MATVVTAEAVAAEVAQVAVARAEVAVAGVATATGGVEVAREVDAMVACLAEAVKVEVYWAVAMGTGEVGTRAVVSWVAEWAVEEGTAVAERAAAAKAQEAVAVVMRAGKAVAMAQAAQTASAATATRL